MVQYFRYFYVEIQLYKHFILKNFYQLELPAKLLDYLLRSTANPTWGDIFENSNLKARTSLLPRFSGKRRSSFEL